jgi:DNA-binding MarR family transcriptional regulator
MAETTQSDEVANERIILGLLESVERDGDQSQRRLASDLGIALGLVNAYLKRCVKKGLVKVNEAPARRYIYYLTPQGFAEKSRLTVEYLSSSFGFFRQAKADCVAALDEARARGFNRIAFAGRSDLAEIAAICALESGLTIAGIVDSAYPGQRCIGLPVFAAFSDLPENVDGIMVTDLVSPLEARKSAIEHFGIDRVLIPSLLQVRVAPTKKSSMR